MLKVTGMQYLYNISKNEVRDGVHLLHALEHQSFYNLPLSFLIIYILFYIVCKIEKYAIEENVAAAFVFNCYANHLDILRGPVMFFATCSSR